MQRHTRFPSVLFLFFVALSSAGTFGLFTACNPAQQVQSTYYSMDSLRTGDPTIEALIAPYRSQLEEKMNVVIGSSTVEMLKAQPESTLGNFTADAILGSARSKHEGKIDFAMSNYGGLRIPVLAAGDITVGNMYELMPFDNMLVLVELTGTEVRQLMDHSIAKGGWPVSEEVSVVVDTVARKASSIQISEKALDDAATYSVLVSDYMANGGDDCVFLKDQPRTKLHYLFRDALIDHVKAVTAEEQVFTPVLEGRMRIE